MYISFDQNVLEWSNGFRRRRMNADEISLVALKDRWWSYLPVNLALALAGSPCVEVRDVQGGSRWLLAASGMMPQSREYGCLADWLEARGIPLDMSEATTL